jgi:hypothetical protein
VKFGKGWVSIVYLSLPGGVNRLPISTTFQTIVPKSQASTNNSILASSTQIKNATSTPKPRPTATEKPKKSNCDPSYPTVCIKPRPPDLDCKDIPYRRFTVLPPDPHNFDGDFDGIGCES